MMQIFDIQTGELTPDNPPLVTMYDVIVKDGSCLKGHYRERISPEELDAFCDGHDIQEIVEVRVPDAAWVEERRRAFEKAWRTSCLMPPVEDLQLLSWAKALPPERAGEIDTEQGIWKMTRDRLYIIRCNKNNEYRKLCLAGLVHSTP